MAKRIAQRELNAAIMDAVVAGESFVITRDAEPVRGSKKSAHFEPLPSTLQPCAATAWWLPRWSDKARRPRSRFADLLITATAHANGLDLYIRSPNDFAGLGDAFSG